MANRIKSHYESRRNQTIQFQSANLLECVREVLSEFWLSQDLEVSKVDFGREI